MNWTRNARAALAGMYPRNDDKRVRKIQSGMILALFSHERDHSDRRVSDDTWKYIEQIRKAKKS